MSEIDSSPENPKIPENWQFPERDAPGLKIDQIDLDQRFLAFSLPDNPPKGWEKNYIPDYGDYFFSSQGKPLLSRRHINTASPGIYMNTEIKLTGDSEVAIHIREDEEHKVEDRRVKFFGVSFLNTSLEESIPLDLLGDVHYGDFVEPMGLESVSIGSCFVRDNKGDFVGSPRAYLTKRSWNKMHDSWSFKEYLQYRRYHEKADMNFILEEQVENEAAIFNKKGELVFKVKWALEEGKSLVASQTHIPTDIIKTLKAPLELDVKEFSGAVFAKPPYPKDERGKLVVPWRNIDRIVGASLSYSYPPPTPQK